MKAENETKNRPAFKVKLGVIRGTIWANEAKNGTRHSVTITHLYKSSDGWKETASNGSAELPLVARVAELAQEWMTICRLSLMSLASKRRPPLELRIILIERQLDGPQVHDLVAESMPIDDPTLAALILL